jgi:hypothetical protein
VALRPLVVDVAEENQQVAIQPTNMGAFLVTTGPAIVPIAPLSAVFWVDLNAPAGGDGSDELPFNTIAAGIAAVAARVDLTGVLLVVPGDYSAQGTIAIPAGLILSIFAFGSASSSAAIGPTVVIAGLDASGVGAARSVFLRGVAVNDFALGSSTVECDLSSILASSGAAGSTLIMRGSGNRLTSIAPVYSGTAGSVQLTSMRAGAVNCATLSLDGCAVPAPTSLTATSTAQFRTSSFAGAGPITCPAISMDRASERSAALAGVLPSSLPTPLEPTNPVYGTGATGNVTLNAGSVALTGVEEYDNLTIAGTGALRCEPFICRVRNLLDLATAGALAVRDFTGGGGSAGAGAVGGGAWGGVAGSTQGNSGTLQTPSGANAVTGAGAQATVAPTLQNAFGGAGGGSGAGGNGDGGAGGAGRAAATVTNARVTPHWPVTFVGPASNATGGSVVTPPLPIMGGMCGQGGSSGAGAGAGPTGGGGGGAGRGGGSVVIYARGIQLGAGTAAGAISSVGQPGGAGGNGQAGNTGGGAAGAGGGGGFVLIAYDWIIGAQGAADEVSASGGAGAAGGAGSGTGTGGFGSDGGAGGQIVFWNLLTNTRTIVLGAAGTAGGAPAGTAGGAAGAGGACTADFP